MKPACLRGRPLALRAADNPARFSPRRLPTHSGAFSIFPKDTAMNQQQMDQIASGKGFIAALDQSGGSTPKALKLYGLDESAQLRSEERRVGKECRSRWSPYH